VTAEQVATLASRLIDLGVRPDSDDDYEEFEDIVLELLDALGAGDGRTNWDG